MTSLIKTTNKFVRFPDYANQIDHFDANSGSYTATEDCFIYFVGYGSNTAYVDIKIGNRTVFSSYNPNTEYTAKLGHLFVPKGEVISIVKSGSPAMSADVFSLK